MMTSITQIYGRNLSSGNGNEESQANQLFRGIYPLYWNVVKFQKFMLRFRSLYIVSKQSLLRVIKT